MTSLSSPDSTRTGDRRGTLRRITGRLRSPVAALLRDAAEPIRSSDPTSLDALVERIGNARIVLIGSSSYGTSEFHRFRASLSRRLVERGFDFIAIEGDWADAARLDDYVLGNGPRALATPVGAFASWLWGNSEVDEFASWLRRRNLMEHARRRPVGVHALDLYSPFASMSAVAAHLDGVDPRAANVARARYGLFTPWQKASSTFARDVLRGRYRESEPEVIELLTELLDARLERARTETHRFYSPAMAARVLANAASHYRAMFYGATPSWKLRDAHMFDSLEALTKFHGQNSRGIVWAHNAHVGDAQGTEMTGRGEVTLGQLVRKKYQKDAYIIGQSTHRGTVGAASCWDGAMQRLRVQPARTDSYEHLLHGVGLGAFTLALRETSTRALRDELLRPRCERNIGVVYEPDRELDNHYFRASLPRQFDELVWFDETTSVEAHAVDVRAARAENQQAKEISLPTFGSIGSTAALST